MVPSGLMGSWEEWGAGNAYTLLDIDMQIRHSLNLGNYNQLKSGYLIICVLSILNMKEKDLDISIEYNIQNLFGPCFEQSICKKAFVKQSGMATLT